MKTITKFTGAAFATLAVAIGAVTANGAIKDLFASVNGQNIDGGGFVYQYKPGGVQTTFASSLSRPRRYLSCP
jgi:hypothetical protein